MQIWRALSQQCACAAVAGILGGAVERQCEGNTKDDMRGVSAVGQKMVKSNIWGKFEILCFLDSVC